MRITILTSGLRGDVQPYAALGLGLQQAGHSVQAIEDLSAGTALPEWLQSARGSQAAGLPSVMVPFTYDQPFWGRRVWELGVGPRPVQRRPLSVERLAGAIMAAVSEKELRRRAQALGERIQREDGVARAVEAFERLCRADHSYRSHK